MRDLRELGAALAEKLGWRVDSDQIYFGRVGSFIRLGHLAATWNGAGLVEEAMRERDLFLVLSDTTQDYEAAFYRLYGTVAGEGKHRDSVPQAIYNAALAALESE